MKPLYQLSDDYLKLYHNLHCDTDEKIIINLKEELDALNEDADKKIINIISLLKNMRLEFDMIESAEKNIIQRKRIYKTQLENLEEYLKSNMIKLGKDKVTNGLHSASVSKGRLKVVIEDETAIPSNFIRIKEVKSPDKESILARYSEDGECIPGVTYEHSYTLRIK